MQEEASRSDDSQAAESVSWRRRLLEVGFWVVLVGFFWTLDTMTQLDLRARTGVGLNDFRLITEQVTSALAALVMVFFVAFWIRQFPLDRSRPLPTLVGHLVGSMLFTVGHYGLFVMMRKLVFQFQGLAYMPSQRHFGNLVFEYKKDLKIYVGMVCIIVLYLYLRRMRAGGSELQPAGRDDGRSVAESSRAGGVDPAEQLELPRRLAVQTRTGERLLDIGDIDYLEAARNYVLVHSGATRHLVRSPLSALLERLPRDQFVRCHRSYLVHVPAIVGVESIDGGQMLQLRAGAQVPVSRSYAEAVQVVLDRMKI